MTIKLFNTRTRTKELFVPIDPDHIRLYVCGPTVYNRAHLGNARAVVVFDLLYRVLKHQYPHVTYVRNITDIDDKILLAAKNRQIPIHELTEQTTRYFHEDMESLQALPPDHEPRATDHVPDMIAMIDRLIQRGHAYLEQGHVVFDVASFPSYGALSQRCLDDMLSGARVEVASYKRSPMDFVLWKPSDPDEMGFESPFGWGRPGWHIECSAMSHAFLGEQFDLHGGGIDLLFPHHENEIAQSCCAFDDPYQKGSMANYWLHNGHLTVDGAKMAKSIGNVLTVQDVLKEHSGEVIRLALLSSNYRQPLHWTDTLLLQAEKTLDRWYGAFQDLPLEARWEGVVCPKVFSALCEDLSTSEAFRHLHALADRCFKGNDAQAQASLWASGRLLGFFQQPLNQKMDHEIDALVAQRQIARDRKDFQESDRLRSLLEAKGVMLEDTPHGTRWRFLRA